MPQCYTYIKISYLLVPYAGIFGLTFLEILITAYFYHMGKRSYSYIGTTCSGKLTPLLICANIVPRPGNGAKLVT